MDTGSPVTFVPLTHFTSLGFDKASLRTSNTTNKGVSGHNLAVLGKFRPRVRTAGGSIVDLDVLVTEEGPAVLGLDGLRALKVQLVLGAEANPGASPLPALPTEAVRLIKVCSNNQGGMRIPPIHLEATGEPRFLKARPLAFSL